jgi:hypothetical protein
MATREVLKENKSRFLATLGIVGAAAVFASGCGGTNDSMSDCPEHYDGPEIQHPYAALEAVGAAEAEMNGYPAGGRPDELDRAHEMSENWLYASRFDELSEVVCKMPDGQATITPGAAEYIGALETGGIEVDIPR